MVFCFVLFLQGIKAFLNILSYGNLLYYACNCSVHFPCTQAERRTDAAH